MQTKQEQTIILTEKAASKIKQMLIKENKQGHGFRIGVSPGGCSGYMYEMSIEEKPNSKDYVIEQDGIKIFVNPESVSFLAGSTVDYLSSLTNSGFKINNPNVKRTCGCGHSVG